jgi:predicted RNase H-like nuclease
VHVVATFAEVVARADAEGVEVLGVDMPIGLPSSGTRVCDGAARARLGPRRSSVFPTPVRAVLGATTYDDALARSRAVDGRGLPVQSFHLLARIAELDAWITPALQDRVVECHPESCFATLAGAPLAEPKRTAAGRHARIDVLRPHIAAVEALASARSPGAGTDDVLDALVVAQAMRRHRRGRAVVLGDGTRDARGLRMEIVV